MSFVDEMANLRVSLEETKERTAKAVKEIKSDARKLRQKAQEIRKKNIKEQKERRQDLAQARAAFWGKKGGK